jgi:hypothetical protein
MSKCQVTGKYIDLETLKPVDFNCTEEPLASGFCIFHDKDYLRDKTNYEEHKTKVLDRLKDKVNRAISNNETLLCIGFQLPEFSLSDLSIISKKFTEPVYFSAATFQGKADFSRAHFHQIADFLQTNFEGEASFSKANFQGEATFSYTKF